MNCRFRRPQASTRLICFPWAGGGASFYTAWGKHITEDVEVIGVCLPGRESRFREPCTSDSEQIIKWIVDTIHNEYFDKPFAFFGHSMGALLSFLVALELKRQYNREPEHLFLSGTIAPHSPHRVARFVRTDNMTKEEFLERLKELGGTPPELLHNEEYMDVFLPSMKADFQMVPHLQSRYEHRPEESPPLTCPTDFFDGADDSDHDIDAWRKVTSGRFTFRTLPGAHFYIKETENIKKLIHYINMRFAGYEDIV